MAENVRISTKQIKQRLELQADLDKALVEQYQHSVMSLHSLQEVEHARARLRFCRELLATYWWDRDKPKNKKKK
jgi:hypothetical protein